MARSRNECIGWQWCDIFITNHRLSALPTLDIEDEFLLSDSRVSSIFDWAMWLFYKASSRCYFTPILAQWQNHPHHRKRAGVGAVTTSVRSLNLSSTSPAVRLIGELYSEVVSTTHVYSYNELARITSIIIALLRLASYEIGNCSCCRCSMEAFGRTRIAPFCMYK